MRKMPWPSSAALTSMGPAMPAMPAMPATFVCAFVLAALAQLEAPTRSSRPQPASARSCCSCRAERCSIGRSR